MGWDCRQPFQLFYLNNKMDCWAFYELICFVFSLSPAPALLCSLFTLLPLATRLFLSASPRTIFQFVLTAAKQKGENHVTWLLLPCQHQEISKFLSIMNWVILMAYWWCSFSFAIDLFVKVFLLLFINAHSDNTNDVFSMFELAKSGTSQRTKTL